MFGLNSFPASNDNRRDDDDKDNGNKINKKKNNASTIKTITDGCTP